MKTIIIFILLLAGTAWAEEPWLLEYKNCMEKCAGNITCMWECVDKLPQSRRPREPDRRIPTSPGSLMMPPILEDVSDQEVRKSLILRWAKDGTICKVLGRHFWIWIPHTTLEYRADGAYPQHRKCELCGKTETKEEVWR